MLFRLKVQPTSETAGTLLLIPVFYSAYTLLVFYRNNNANPLIYSFATELFAFLAVMFAMYATAAFHFGKRRPRLLRFASMAGIYLLVTVLCSDNLLPFFTKGHLHFDTADLLTMGGFLVLLCAHLFVLGPLLRGIQQDLNRAIPPEPGKKAWLLFLLSHSVFSMAMWRQCSSKYSCP